MPYEYTPPKYAQVIAELQRRIESGEYPPGSLMPSEHQLSGEFGIARPTVVRALRVLRQEGWIETQQGKGSFVRGRPALAGVTTDRRGQAELERDEARKAASWSARPGRPAPPDRRAAGLAGRPGAGVPQAADPTRRRTLRAGDLVVPAGAGGRYRPDSALTLCAGVCGRCWLGRKASGWIMWSSR